MDKIVKRVRSLLAALIMLAVAFIVVPQFGADEAHAAADFLFVENGIKYACDMDNNTAEIRGYRRSDGPPEHVRIPVRFFLFEVTGIADDAFRDCKDIKSVTIGVTDYGEGDVKLKRIGNNAFSGCSSLPEIRFEGTEAKWRGISLGKNWATKDGLKVRCKYDVAAAPAEGGKVEGEAEIVYGPDGKPKADKPVTATVRAIPKTGYIFDGWTSGSNVTFADKTAAETTLETFAHSTTSTGSFKIPPLAGKACIAFTSDAGFTVKLGPKKWNGSILYSLDNSNWETYEADTPIKSDDGQPIYFTGVGNKYLSGLNDHARFSLEPDGNNTVSCYGNAEALLDYWTVLEGKHPEMWGHAFAGLFANCSSLASAPSLPAESLRIGCYESMFLNCTSLTAAPELPATKLDGFNYKYMFKGCTSLKVAQDELPATDLSGNNYYVGMFEGCTSLTQAPEILATTIGDGSCMDMFKGCTSLTRPPELNATEIGAFCYYRMFDSCKSLATAPELPATELAESCYNQMFYNCSSLAKAPELPATKLAKDCYRYMFDHCIAIETPPRLPAAELAEGCYEGMFKTTGIRLSKENGTFRGVYYGIPYRIPSENDGTDAEDALTDMFKKSNELIYSPFSGTPDINTTYYLPAEHSDALPPSGKTLVYNGSRQTGVDPGEGYMFTGSKATDAGEYTATATLLNGYVWSDGSLGTREVSYRILPKQLTITVNDASKVEGRPDPAFTGKIEGLAREGDLGKVTFRRTGGSEKPGKYAGVITASYKANPNYKVTVVNGDFTIKPRAAGTIIPKVKAKGKKGLIVSWNKVKDAAGYDIFFAKCSSHDKASSCKKVKTIKGNKKFKWTKTGLKKGTAYKAYVKAYVMQSGKKKYVGTSPLMHVFTGSGTKKYTNAKSVKLKNVKKGKLSLKKGKTFKIKAKVIKINKNKKLMGKGHAPTLRYLTSNKKVATVSKSGKVIAKGSGTCYIYVFAHNGVSKSIKVKITL